jgi:hypothetical protein
MFTAETRLVDAVLKFAIIDLPTFGLKEGISKLRTSFTGQLQRFSEEFDLKPREEALIELATIQLSKTLICDNVWSWTGSNHGEAKRYRLLRDYLLSNGFVVFQKIKEGDEPFVSATDFYGATFEDAVDTLERLGE